VISAAGSPFGDVFTLANVAGVAGVAADLRGKRAKAVDDLRRSPTR
jgi:hypothetical protein